MSSSPPSFSSHLPLFQKAAREPNTTTPIHLPIRLSSQRLTNPTRALSLAVNYTHATQFRSSGYAPFLVNGTDYGAVRQFGNFSFVRVYEAGHLVPYYQPLASLELFRRAIEGRDMATGEMMLRDDLSTTGPPNSTRTEPFVPLPKETGEDGEPPKRLVWREGERKAEPRFAF